MSHIFRTHGVTERAAKSSGLSPLVAGKGCEEGDIEGHDPHDADEMEFASVGRFIQVEVSYCAVPAKPRTG